jgi:hypothetical protein
MTSSWYGGLGPGFFAMALSVLATPLLPQTPPLETLDLSDTMPLFVFVAVAILISGLHSRVRAARMQAEQLAAANQSLFLSERQARAEAEASTRIRDEFLAMVSHELRNPLNSISGWVSLMRTTNGTDAATVTHALSVIERNVRMQKVLVEDLVDFSQMRVGKLRINDLPVDMLRVVNAAIEAMRPGAEQKRVRISVEFKCRMGFVRGDADRLEQVLSNLLSNALKFTAAGGCICVKLDSVDDQLELTVSDSGIGIPANFLPLVFERFSQLDEENSCRFGGLGLGLSIARQLVELHRGTIQALSPGEGRGSAFIVRLPKLRVEEGFDRQLIDEPFAKTDLAQQSASACSG